MTEIIGLFGRIVSLLTIPLMALTIWGLIRQTRKEQRVTPYSPLIGIVMAPLTLIVNIVFLRQAFSAFLGPGLLIFGIAFGLAWGQTARLYPKGKAIVAKRSIMHLVFWAISYAITQVLATFAPAFVVAGGLATMFFSTGSTLGTNLNLLVRQMQMRLSSTRAGPPSFLPEAALVTPHARHRLPEGRAVRPPTGLPERGTEKRDWMPPTLPR